MNVSVSQKAFVPAIHHPAAPCSIKYPISKKDEIFPIVPEDVVFPVELCNLLAKVLLRLEQER